MKVRKNSFTEMSPENKGKRINQLRNGNPTWPGRGGNPTNKNNDKVAHANKKMFSEVLREIYTGKGGPRRLKKLALVCIEYAEAGHARFAELILDRLEGPVKHEPSTVNNLMIFSDAERERAKSVVDDILAMDKTIVVPQIAEEIISEQSNPATEAVEVALNADNPGSN